MKLAIVVGHTRLKPGAVMHPPYSYIDEYCYNRMMAAIMSNLCGRRNLEHEVILRDKIGIAGAYAEAKRLKVDACIELHFNGFSNTGVKGMEVLYGSIPGSLGLATAVHRKLAAKILMLDGKINDRGLKFVKYNKDNPKLSDPGGANCNNDSGRPTILIEPFFGTNLESAEFGLLHIREIAYSVIAGFSDWCSSQGGGLSSQAWHQ